MGCFGFSRKKVAQNMDDTVKIGGVKKSRWISWSKFLTKKFDVKTVPVESPVSEKINRSRELDSLIKSLANFSSKKHRQATGINPDNIPATGPDQTVNNKAHKKRSEIEEDIILENRELGHSVAKDDTGQKPSSRIKDNKRTGCSNPGWPPVNKNVSKKTTASPPHSESPPAARKRKKHKEVSGGDDHNVIRETDGRFDPIFGVSIVMVTLVIMLVWGKLCAILCTSAWLFMVPRLIRRAMDSNVVVENGLNSGERDLNSEDYKKKVVLEGLLQRNRRSTVIGIL